MELHWIVIIACILFIIIFTVCRLCCLLWHQRVRDKQFDSPSKFRTSSRSSVQSVGSIKSLIKNPNKVDELMNWMADTPHKFSQTEATPDQEEEKLRGGTKDFSPLNPTSEYNEYVEKDTSDNEMGLTSDQIEEMEMIYQSEKAKDFSPLRPSVETNNDIESENTEEQMMLSSEDVEKGMVDYSYWKGIDYKNDSVTQEAQTTNCEVMQTTKQESIHTSDTLPLNATLDLIHGNSENDEFFVSNNAVEKTMQETSFEVDVKNYSTSSSNVQITEQKSSNVVITSSSTELKSVQQSSSVDHFETTKVLTSETNL